MIIIINGAPGSGKSKTAELLNRTITQSAWIDGDWTARVNPDNPDRTLNYTNIASLAKNYVSAGYNFIIISFVYGGPTSLSKQIELISDLGKIKVFNLIPNEEELRNRHKNDGYVRESIEGSLSLIESIRKINDAEIIDNSSISTEETVEIIKNRLREVASYE